MFNEKCVEKDSGRCGRSHESKKNGTQPSTKIRLDGDPSFVKPFTIHFVAEIRFRVKQIIIIWCHINQRHSLSIKVLLGVD